MVKLNATIYYKLILQAEEAQEQGFTKLAQNVLGNADVVDLENDLIQYSYGQLQDDAQQALWKIACQVLKHYDLTSVDIQKIDTILNSYAGTIIGELEQVLGINDVKSPIDPKVMGEK